MATKNVADVVRAAVCARHDDVLTKACYTRERHALMLADVLAITGTQSVLEIGAHAGLTTCVYLACPLVHRVYVVDPYDGAQQGNEDVMLSFFQNTDAHRDRVCMLRDTSQSMRGKEFIRQIPHLGFAFVDGLHTYAAARDDIESCAKADAAVICVDDVKGYWQFSAHLMAAVQEGCARYGYHHAQTPDNVQETYLVRADLL